MLFLTLDKSFQLVRFSVLPPRDLSGEQILHSRVILMTIRILSNVCCVHTKCANLILRWCSIYNAKRIGNYGNFSIMALLLLRIDIEP